MQFFSSVKIHNDRNNISAYLKTLPSGKANRVSQVAKQENVLERHCPALKINQSPMLHIQADMPETTRSYVAPSHAQTILADIFVLFKHQYVFLYSFGPVGATEAESAEESYAFGLE